MDDSATGARARWQHEIIARPRTVTMRAMDLECCAAGVGGTMVMGSDQFTLIVLVKYNDNS